MHDAPEALLAFFSPKGVDALYDLARREQWQFVQAIHPLEDRFEEKIWRTKNDSLVRLIDDHFVNIRYVVIQGDDCKRVAEEVKAMATVVDLNDALEMTTSEFSDDRIVGSKMVAALAPVEFEPRIHEAFTRLVRDSEPDVRSEVLIAISRLGWVQFLPEVERLTRDSEPQIAEDAKLLVELLRDERGRAQPGA